MRQARLGNPEDPPIKSCTLWAPACTTAFANQYYGVELPLEPIQAIYDHAPLTAELIAQLNPENSLEELTEDDQIVVATVVDLLRRGEVRLIGNFRDERLAIA